MKIKELIIKLKSNKKYYYATIMGLVLLIGVTFAYVIDQISGGAISKVFITADTADNLEFVVDKDLSIKPTQFNFVNGGEDLSDTATATARLKANSTNNKATYEYYVYFYIERNEYIYTTPDHKPEMILQVTDPNGAIVTSINGLTYNNSLQGFDITEIDGVITIAKGHEITSNSSTSFTEQNWIFTVKFINLDSNQIENEGKTLEGKILIQKDVIKTFDITVSNLATSAGSLANFDCPDATAIYNYKYNELQISNLNDYSKFKNCNISFTARTEKQLLNEKIISLETETASRTDWKVVNEHGYRYEGKEPENYIWFNNELWRIIGVFGEEMHGQTGEQLVKIIRNESIGRYSFGYGKTWWSSNVFNLLNQVDGDNDSGSYYLKKDGTHSRYCNTYKNSKYEVEYRYNCDYREIGIRNDYRNMIKEVIWKTVYLPFGQYLTINEIFDKELASTGTTYRIGIMYPSDYSYGALTNYCARTTKLTESWNYPSNCFNNNWLNSIESEFLNFYQNSYPGIKEDSGHIYNTSSSLSRRNVRPVLYLNQNVYVIEGTGSITDPYVIGI